MTDKRKLLEMDHFGLQIMQDGMINIDETNLSGSLIFAVCGLNEGPRSYVTSWYDGKMKDFGLHIYLSDELKQQEANILDMLAKKLEKCSTIQQVMVLNGSMITY